MHLVGFVYINEKLAVTLISLKWHIFRLPPSHYHHLCSLASTWRRDLYLLQSVFEVVFSNVSNWLLSIKDADMT